MQDRPGNTVANTNHVGYGPGHNVDDDVDGPVMLTADAADLDAHLRSEDLSVPGSVRTPRVRKCAFPAHACSCRETGLKASDHRLLVEYRIMTGACARLGLGARSVALTSAAHDASCGSLLACAGPGTGMSRERLKRDLLGSK